MEKLNFIQRLTRRIGILYDSVAFNFYGLIVLVLIFLFYWNFPQAKDLLLTLNQEGPLQLSLFFLTMITIAAINWYLPRYLYPENNDKLKSWRSFFEEEMDEHCLEGHMDVMNDEEAYKMRMIEMIPRLIGAFILMIVGLGILNVGHEMDPRHIPWNLPAGYILMGLFLFTATLLLFGKTGRPWMFSFSDWLRQGLGRWIYGFLTVVVVMIGIALFLNRGDFKSLQFLFYAMVLVSFSFLFITMARKQMAWISVDQRVIKIIFVLAIVQSLYFVLINFITGLSQQMNPLICANLAFIFYLTLFYLVRVIGVSKKTYFVFFFLLIVFLAANITTSAHHHEISYSEGEKALFQPDKRKDLYQYFQHWVNDRVPVIEQYLAEQQAQDSTKPARYPVIVVSSQGGGSRAAYWTNITHHYLDSRVPDYYDNHLFAMTGASGGNTGNSTYFSMKEAGVGVDSVKSYAYKMFMGNFLSSSLTLFLGSDFWQSTFGISAGNDRAKQLEIEWTRRISELTNGEVNTYSDPFLSFWYQSGTTELKKKKAPPLLLINTTHVQMGNHAVISPVRLDDQFYDALDLLYAVDTMSKNSKTIPLSTANLLNASFPYINPAGNVKNIGSFVDAGYYDNYGAQTGIGIFRHLQWLRQNAASFGIENADLYKKLRFISVLIRNGTVDPSVPPSPASSQFLAPAFTLGNIRGGVNIHNIWALQTAADQFYKIDLPARDSIQIMLPGEDELISPIIPLARYLSPSALMAMDEGLKVLERNKDSDLNKLIEDLH